MLGYSRQVQNFSVHVTYRNLLRSRCESLHDSAMDPSTSCGPYSIELKTKKKPRVQSNLALPQSQGFIIAFLHNSDPEQLALPHGQDFTITFPAWHGSKATGFSDWPKI